ncbi:MAG: cytochrome c [Gammaproteobacteria bacterium]|nr:cytochrome c [Gammaproteobacteria bacterium]MDH3412578.1 cytochrome c [Gammaproteobacteria bacterium]
MKKTTVLLVAVAASFVAANALAAGDAAAGKSKSAACAACHGPDGNSTNPVWPNLAGQHGAYLVKQLKAFKSGERKDPLMSPMAAGLSEQDMENLAAYYAGQKAK